MFELSAVRCVAAVAGAYILLGAAAQGGEAELRGLAERAVSADASEAESARARLRAAGPQGLDVLLEAYAAILAHESAVDDGLEARVHAALDAVAAQRHAASSRLYWYTDLEEAKAEARRTHKPILSLRLLGRLDEPFSCANSRFFRTVLYPNREVADVLRDRFVLHWTSERPAPRVTIDFGDGRRLEGTITGNSIHYILDAEGRPLDALPGLYGPAAFLRGLRRAEAVAGGYRTRHGAAREAWLREYHRQRLNELATDWKEDLERAGLPPASPPWQDGAVIPATATVRALDADRRAMAKSLVERPVLTGLFGAAAESPDPRLTLWSHLADIRADDARLDAGALGRMRADGIDPTSEPGALPAFERTVRAFERLVAMDSVRNEYVFHARIHGWFAAGNAARDLEALNARVYSTLFLTPRTDPWLGLVPPDGYTALGGTAWAGR
jgi:hypothetical protein